MISVIVKTSLDMFGFLNCLSQSNEFILDLETTGLRPFKGNYPIGYGFYIPKFDIGYYVPVEHIIATMDDNGIITEENHEDNIDEEWFIQKLNETIQPGSNNINFNIKFDYHNYQIAGLDTNLFTIEDVQVSANIYDENELRYSLDILAGKYLGERKETDALEEAYRLIKDERIIRLKKKKEEYKQLELDYQVLEIEAQIKYIRAKKAVEHYAELSPDLVGSYCIHDCYITWKLREFYKLELKKQSATKTRTLWDLSIEQREYTQALAEAEHHGILIDPDYCQQEIEFNRSRQQELAGEMQLSLGKEFNPRSNQDIQRILYGTTGLAKLYPADEAAIEKAKTPIGLKLKEFKKIEKATGTYFEAFLRFSDSNNYIHPHFNQHRTVSSRLSSSEPNFQNIPRLDEDKLEVKPENRYISRVRHAIIAPEGMLILANDYCLHPDTLVDGMEGHIEIKNIKAGDRLFAYNNGKITWDTVISSGSVRNLPAYKITLDNDEEIICSEDHKWPTKTGIKLTKELKIKDILIPLKYHYVGGYTHLYSDSSFNYTKEHQIVAEAYYGVCEDGYEVHHKDKNKSNNLPDNLEYKSIDLHRSEHGINNYQNQNHDYRIVKLREGIKKRISYIGENNLNYGRKTSVKSNCLYCNVELFYYPSQNKKYCSRDCYWNAYREGLNHKIINIEYIGLQPMWGISMQKYGNYALSCGVFTMNSQIELRLLAHYSKDPVLMDAYLNDKDVHQMTGDAVGVSRQSGKCLNFAIVYGAGPNKIGSMLGISEAKGKAIYSEYQQKLPGVWDFVKRVSYHAVKYREVTLWTGRKRRFTHDAQLNSAVNNVIQGGAAEVFRYAITRLYRKFKDDPEAPKFILPVHDDVTFYAKESNYKDYLPIIKSEMERWSFSIPIKVDSKIGKRWDTMEKIR